MGWWVEQRVLRVAREQQVVEPSLVVKSTKEESKRNILHTTASDRRLNFLILGFHLKLQFCCRGSPSTTVIYVIMVQI